MSPTRTTPPYLEQPETGHRLDAVIVAAPNIDAFARYEAGDAGGIVPGEVERDRRHAPRKIFRAGQAENANARHRGKAIDQLT